MIYIFIYIYIGIKVKQMKDRILFSKNNMLKRFIRNLRCQITSQ